MGDWLSDKYAKASVGRRLYAGCEIVDRVELIAAGHAHVQPHSGIKANLVAFWAILARRVEEPALRAAGARHVNDLPRRTGSGCGGNCIPSACSAWHWTPAAT